MRRLAPLLLLLLLTGCPSAPCASDVEVEIGAGNRASGFLALEDGAALPMWSVRHEWNRMVPINLRAHGLEPGQGQTFGVRLGLYQGGELVAGTSIDDAASEAGGDDTSEFLGLLAQVVTYEYEAFSGQPTRVEAELTDLCGATFTSGLDAVIWAPEDLCALEPEPATVQVGGDGREAFAPLEALSEVDVVALEGGEGLVVGARASSATSPLTSGHALRRVLLVHDGDEIGRVEEEPTSPDRWTLEEADFLGIEVPLVGPAPASGAEIDVQVVLTDACGRELQGEVAVVLR